MNEHSYLVLGAGGVGPAIASWLLRQPDTYRVTIADSQFERARDAMRRVATESDIVRNRCMAIHLDATGDEHQVVAAFSGVHVVISAIPARYSPGLAKTAVGLGTHFCDLGGVLSITQDMRESLHAQAEKAGISVIPDCGLMPGLGNMIASHLARRMGLGNDITVYVGGLPQKPLTEAGNYQRTFSLEGLLHILEPAPVLVGGAIVEVAPFDALELLDVPALERFDTGFGGAVEAFTSNGAGTAASSMKRLLVRNFREKTVRWPGFVKFIQSIPRDRLLPTLERLLPPTDAQHPDLVWMRVVARKAGKVESFELLDTYDPATGFSAMARTTGFSAAAVAQAAASGATAPGVLPPEEALQWLGIRSLLSALDTDLKFRYEAS